MLYEVITFLDGLEGILEAFGIRAYVPFSSQHRYQRTDSAWAGPGSWGRAAGRGSARQVRICSTRITSYNVCYTKLLCCQRRSGIP